MAANNNENNAVKINQLRELNRQLSGSMILPEILGNESLRSGAWWSVCATTSGVVCTMLALNEGGSGGPVVWFK